MAGGRRYLLPTNAGKPWSPEEDNSLAASFDKGTPVRKMASEHGRTEGAIASRLVRLGRLTDRSGIFKPGRD